MRVPTLLFTTLALLSAQAWGADRHIDFTTEIRPLLSNKCFACHGPDADERQAGLRLDSAESALSALESGNHAIVPGQVAASELLTRVRAEDPDVRMPPAKFGKPLTEHEIQLLEQWVAQGAPFAEHWSYVKPHRPSIPEVADAQWCRNEIDFFILARLQREQLVPTPEADRYTLIRRVSLDLIGLPPTPEEVAAFIQDDSPQAYEALVDRLLQKPSYGEHWARKWLDLARYADSAGYADDPSRVIWGYRDWVIRAYNDNMPFDQFTIAQLAGDLLPNPTADQLVATAFHRNTLTNNEGGTSDEEFRNVAIVDRVNTTLATWMGTTMACAQCHSHKYDPITQEDYFRFFAILNNTEDADRRDESPLLEIYSAEQRQQKTEWQTELAQLEEKLVTVTPELQTELQQWATNFQGALPWQPLTPSAANSREQAPVVIQERIVAVNAAREQDVLTIDLPLTLEQPMTAVQAIRLSTYPAAELPGAGSGYGGGNFVVTRVSGVIKPQGTDRALGRYVRIELPGQKQFLSLAEVQVLSGSENIALKGQATQSSTDFGGPPELAIDGNTSGVFTDKSTTHTAQDDSPWWEVDLQSLQAVDHIHIWNRTDASVGSRLANFKVTLFNEAREIVWEQMIEKSPDPNLNVTLSGARGITFVAAFADHEQPGFAARNVIDANETKQAGWAIGGQTAEPHALTLIPAAPLNITPGDTLSLTVEQLSTHINHTVGRLSVEYSTSPQAAVLAQLPPALAVVARLPEAARTSEQQQELAQYYVKQVSPTLAPDRDRLEQVKKLLAEQKPLTTVPIFRELAAAQQRKTFIQIRGNYLVQGDEVTPGLPAAFATLPAAVVPDRLVMARWLVDADNPLTARVIANRYWESIFGRGIVLTSEEFGSQGELPSHPELLDWLATELVQSGWNTKALLKLLVTSSAYRQSSAVTPELYDHDPDNMLLARGPRVRLTAEMIRDQTLAVAGLLSPKMYGPPVNPLQPNMGLSAAFGSGIDWQTSMGEDKYRRGLYTNWRRSNPYPSMSTFDAPNREVCTVRRTRTNTPLQALVTLNDPVYVEAAQSLARRMAAAGPTPAEQIASGIEQCLGRPPRPHEVEELTNLYIAARQHFETAPDAALKLATVPLGPLPEGMHPLDLAAGTAVANVLLNLDEMFMKR